MKDIAKAYKAEQNYYADKERLHSNTLDIMNYLTPCGYDNYDDYYNDVQEYKLKIQDYDIVEAKDIAEDVYMWHIKNKKPAFFYIIHSSNNYAFVPLNFEHDEIFKEYNIIPAHMTYKTDHGIIITSDGDLRVVIISDELIEIHINYFLNKLQNYLSKFFDNVIIDNNDVLINNKKVIGSGFINMNNMNIYMFQITFVDRTDLIKKICTDSIKETSYIDPNILTPEQLKDEFLSWLKV